MQQHHGADSPAGLVDSGKPPSPHLISQNTRAAGPITFSSALRHALGEEHHFALVEKLHFSTKGSLAIVAFRDGWTKADYSDVPGGYLNLRDAITERRKTNPAKPLSLRPTSSQPSTCTLTASGRGTSRRANP